MREQEDNNLLQSHPESHLKDGVKEKNFNNCPFKISLPKISVLEGTIKLNFRMLAKPGISVDVSLNETYLTDKLNRKYDNYYMGECKLKENGNKNFAMDIPIKKRDFFIPESLLVLYFLAGDYRRYEIAYKFRKDKGISLDYVMGRRLSSEEISWHEKSIHMAKEKAALKDDKHAPEVVKADIVGKKNRVHQIPKLEEYKKALFREMYFIKEGGGRKHKLNNGTLINHKNGMSTYSFEMEAELNLSDDAPITLYIGTNEASGSVLVCEGFQIIVIIDKDFGSRIGQAMLGVEPWKLIEALVNKIDSVTGSPMAMKLINEGPGLATTDSADHIPKGQLAAIEAARNNDITVIWGPPGTGKTYTMANIAKEGLKKKKSILIVSHSNVSVDGVIKQIVAGLREGKMEDQLAEGKVLRYGYVRDEELSQNPLVVAYNYVLHHKPEIKRKIDELYQERDQLKRTDGYNSYKGEHVEKELKKLRAEVRAEERQYISKAMLVATTISKVTIDPFFDVKEYDIVMFDEVSMAYVPQIICAASYARNKLVLVGDFRQLSPIVQSDAKTVLGSDIFAYLGISDGTKVHAHPWLVMLNEQRRMHPAISAFANKTIYNNLLLDYENVESSRKYIVNRQPLPGNAVNLINMAGSYSAAMKNSDNSRFNILSAIVSFLTAIQAEDNGEDSIGIITPYAAQTRLIRAMIQDHRKNNSTDVACSTVHQFQGSERNLIIFDAVENYPASKVGWLMGKERDSVSRLINVAVTRARGKLIAVANATFWENKFGGTQHAFYQLVKYLMESGKVVSVKEKTLAPYIQQLPSTRNFCLYQDVNDAIDDFRLDVKKAQETVTISIPDGKLDAETQDVVLKIILDAAKKGIRILCKTNGYEDLPERWKSIAWASDDAVFPLIIIDDKVAWYGFPKSRGMFRDGNSGYVTVCQTVYRIRGEHTLEMIKAFSDIEYRLVNGQRKPLLEKNGKTDLIKHGIDDDSEDDGKGTAGLDAFIRNKEKCTRCKSPMTVTRSRQGKVFLRCSCSSCNEIAYLTPEMTNSYIEREHVTCPTHHCGIHAGLGKYGIYVRCDQGHFLKPDEI